MTTRSVIMFLCTVLLSAALTASVFVVKDALTFDPFAEITILNSSGQQISRAEIRQGKLTVTVQGVFPGRKYPVYFCSDPTLPDKRYSLTIHFVDGRMLHEDANVISNGGKHEVIISQDRINTGYVRSTTL